MENLVNRFNLWLPEQQAAAEDISGKIRTGEIDLIRFVWPDQHGILRGKTLVGSAASNALWEGVNLTSTLIAKDTSHRTTFQVFANNETLGSFNDMQGAADFTIVADPTTFRILPWASKTGWVICDAYTSAGNPHPLGTRQILQRAVSEVDALQFEFVAGLEVELHIFKLDDANLQLGDSGQPGEPVSVSLLTKGYQYLTELRYDQVEPVLDLLRRQLITLGLPLESLEIEYGPSQFELVFGPMLGVAPADAMMLLRSAIKQTCWRNGYHATFMCRPRIPNVMSSGWHLHQSLRRKNDGYNVFIPDQDGKLLSQTGLCFLAGLRHHACGSIPFACPTINGYRRYQSYSLAPDRATWARDNRGAMLRVLGGVGQKGTRIENRAGEPAANPYLYLASQIFSGLDGIRHKLDPGPSADTPYDSAAEKLPRSLSDALSALKVDDVLTESMGLHFIEYYCHIKNAEIDRFNLEVSEWEHREYFDLF